MAYIQLPEVLLKTDTKKLKKLLTPISNPQYSKWFIKENIVWENIFKSGNLTILKNTYKDIRKIATSDILYMDYVPITFKVFEEIKRKNIAQIPKQWDIDKVYNYLNKVACELYSEERVDVISSTKDDIDVIIYYPEIKITNSIELEHTMRDVYIKYSFYKNSEYGWGLEQISISRTTFEIRELQAGYIFSHTPSRDTPVCWNSTFCYGSTDLGDFVSNCTDYSYNTLFTEYFPKLLLAFDEYLQWESLEGVPYNKIDNLLSNIDTSDLEKSSRCYYSGINTELIYKVLDNVHLGYNYVLADGKYSIMLTEEAMEDIRNFLTVTYPTYCYIWYNGESYNKRSNSPAKKALMYHGQDSAVKFKGEIKKICVVDIEDIKEKEYEYSIHKCILDYVKDILELKLKNYLIQKQLGWKPKEILVQEPQVVLEGE
jgi:hypothetical protein